jgi:uncharacterized protein (DUF362 family)
MSSSDRRLLNTASEVGAEERLLTRAVLKQNHDREGVVAQTFVGRYLTRRRALASAAGVLAGCGRSSWSAAEPVLISRASSYGNDVYGIVRNALAEHRLRLQGKTVLLKPNLVEYDAERPINTDPVLVHAVMEACHALGAGQVRIAEGPGHRRATLELAEAAGYFTTIPGFENIFTDLNVDEVSRVDLASPRSKMRSLYLPKRATTADLIISIPKLKTHHWAGATLSMKNLFGVVPGAVYGWPKNILHWAGIDESVADLHSLFQRHFAVVDGIEGMEGNGPIQGSGKHAGVIVTGRDLVAVDATCCRIMGIDPNQIKYLELAAGREITENSVRQIGERIESVATRFAVIPELRHILLKEKPA